MFVVVSLEGLRQKLKGFIDMKPASLHITLGFLPSDVHSVPKNCFSLISSIKVDEVNDKIKVEIKNLVKASAYPEALHLINELEIGETNPEFELLDIKALILFKLSRYEESLLTIDELLLSSSSSLELPAKLKCLALIRQADSLVALCNFKAALLPIWKSFLLLTTFPELILLKNSSYPHLVNLLQKCARHGFLRIDVLPVNRMDITFTSESEEHGNLMIRDKEILTLFELYKRFDVKEYAEILKIVTEEYNDISHESFDDRLPLECRWISIASPDYQPSILPRNFSYLWPNLLAVSSTPRHTEDIRTLSEIGIRLVITLTEEEPLKSEWFKNSNTCDNLFIPVPNYQPPSIPAMDRIVWEVARSVNSGKPVLIHCGGGKGRAGTAAACVIMALGMDPNAISLCSSCSQKFRPMSTCPSEDCNMNASPIFDPATCLHIIRQLRPESLETVQQEAFLKTYSSALWQRVSLNKVENTVVQEELEEDTLELYGVYPKKLPKVIVLSGLPGSGKSTFALDLKNNLEGLGVEVDHINQDALSGREAFEQAISAASKTLSKAQSGRYVLVIDRCNATKKDRQIILDLLFNPDKSAVLFVHFDLDSELCIQRIEQRFTHLTLKPTEGRRVVKHFTEIMVIPELSDNNNGGCSSLFIIKSIADSRKALKLLESFVKKGSEADVVVGKSIESDSKNFKAEKMDKFYKFPRTEHLFNLGGATRDDLILSSDEFKAFFSPAPGKTITMEEKIDGANVGFSLDVVSGKILCQNRSHYVDSKYHFQFQSLGSFIYQKSEALRAVLQNGRILYGEWMFAKHSIHYTALPDLFIAFDIFDPQSGKFVDRATFYEIMQNTNIAYVQPLIPNPEKYATRDALEKLMKSTKSAFSDSIIEGIYFRWDQNGTLKTRSKLV